MVFFRLVTALFLFAIAACVGFWFFTGDQKYFRWAVQIFKALLTLAFVFFGMLILMRI